jgi:hypothetical protein
MSCLPPFALASATSQQNSAISPKKPHFCIWAVLVNHSVGRGTEDFSLTSFHIFLSSCQEKFSFLKLLNLFSMLANSLSNEINFLAASIFTLILSQLIFFTKRFGNASLTLSIFLEISSKFASNSFKPSVLGIYFPFTNASQ